jgi:hypothetical protein
MEYSFDPLYPQPEIPAFPFSKTADFKQGVWSDILGFLIA